MYWLIDWTNVFLLRLQKSFSLTLFLGLLDPMYNMWKLECTAIVCMKYSWKIQIVHRIRQIYIDKVYTHYLGLVLAEFRQCSYGYSLIDAWCAKLFRVCHSVCNNIFCCVASETIFVCVLFVRHNKLLI